LDSRPEITPRRLRNFTAGKTHDAIYRFYPAHMHRGGLSRRYRLYRAGSAA